MAVLTVLLFTVTLQLNEIMILYIFFYKQITKIYLNRAVFKKIIIKWFIFSITFTLQLFLKQRFK